MIRTFEGETPEIAESAYVDETAVVIGDVMIEAEASVWPNVTLRGDSGRIRVGAGANVQDNAVMHENAELEPHTTVGHCGIVHAATVEERALVGMNAVVLDGATVGEGAVVSAGAVVTEGTEVPPETLVTGVPAEPKTDLDGTDPGVAADHYVDLASRHEEGSERID